MKTKTLRWLTPILFISLLSIALGSCGGSSGGGGGDTNQSPIANIAEITGPMSPGLLAYYPFSGNANDESGNGNDGVVYGTVNGGATLTTDRFGDVVSAYSFDGVDDFIEIIPQSDMSTTGDFTVMAWTYLTDWKIQNGFSMDRQYIFNGHAHSATVTNDYFRDGFSLMYDGNAQIEEIHNLYCYSDLSGYCGSWVETNTQVNIKGNWHLNVFVRSGTNDYTYLDGALINSTYDPTSVNSNALLDMNHTWYIGTFSGNNPSYNGGVFNFSFNGVIDEVRIYNRALSDVEITERYISDRTVFRSTDTIIFSGTGTDTEDGTLTATSLVWSSDIDGQLGTGNTVSTSLSAGIHTIILTVMDSLGATATATDTITVHEPPSTSIISPTDGAAFTTIDSIAFTGSATDLEDGVLSGTSLVWSSNIDGQLGEGESITASLSVGTHTISLAAIDSYGASDTSTVEITITNPVEILILSEDFEDGILDSRITVGSVGAFNSASGIKDTALFGSTKAFGYGRSSCGASCFDNYYTSFLITFSQSTFVSNISFREMELYGNWGSKGHVILDGSWLTQPEFFDFGRTPSNDFTADSTYREHTFSINDVVTTIELRVRDITNSSEIFIDDLKVYGSAP